MSRFKIPVTWEMYGEYVIEADTLEQAIEQAYSSSQSLPNEKHYIDDSLIVDTESCKEIKTEEDE